jgi:hypothetical protein
VHAPGVPLPAACVLLQPFRPSPSSEPQLWPIVNILVLGSDSAPCPLRPRRHVRSLMCLTWITTAPWTTWSSGACSKRSSPASPWTSSSRCLPPFRCADLLACLGPRGWSSRAVTNITGTGADCRPGHVLLKGSTGRHRLQRQAHPCLLCLQDMDVNGDERISWQEMSTCFASGGVQQLQVGAALLCSSQHDVRLEVALPLPAWLQSWGDAKDPAELKRMKQEAGGAGPDEVAVGASCSCVGSVEARFSAAPGRHGWLTLAATNAPHQPLH